MPREERERFARAIRLGSFVLILIGAALFGVAFVYFIFYGGFSSQVFSIYYPLAFAILLSGLALYIAYHFDKRIHEHLDEIQLGA